MIDDSICCHLLSVLGIEEEKGCEISSCDHELGLFVVSSLPIDSGVESHPSWKVNASCVRVSNL